MLRDQSVLTKLVWAALLIIAADALIQWELSLLFIALATLSLSLAPVVVARWAQIHVPSSFMLAVVLFVGGTLLLGEVYGFYTRFWWWDMLMHGGSAVGFGLIGFVLVFMMFQGDKFAAPPAAVAFFLLSALRWPSGGRCGKFSNLAWISSLASTCRNPG